MFCHILAYEVCTIQKYFFNCAFPNSFPTSVILLTKIDKTFELFLVKQLLIISNEPVHNKNIHLNLFVFMLRTCMLRSKHVLLFI